MNRILAIIERDMRRFRRSPTLMIVSMVMPLVQLVVLGYAFGGKIKNAPVAIVDEDHSVQSRRIQEMFDGIAAGPKTIRVVDYNSLPQALDDVFLHYTGNDLRDTAGGAKLDISHLYK